MTVASNKPKNAGTLLIFSESMGDDEEKNVRMIITDEFLRLDEGPQSQDYLLFDRAKKIIYNVVSEDKTVLVIDPPVSSLKPDYPLLWLVQSQTSHALMRGQKSDDRGEATHYQFFLNESHCYDIVTIEGILDEALAAIKAFRLTLADELKQNYHAEKDQQCFEAVNVFDPTNHLQYGFPIREWSVFGYQRFLVDYRMNMVFPADLFVLPENHRTLTH